MSVFVKDLWGNVFGWLFMLKASDVNGNERLRHWKNTRGVCRNWRNLCDRMFRMDISVLFVALEKIGNSGVFVKPELYDAISFVLSMRIDPNARGKTIEKLPTGDYVMVSYPLVIACNSGNVKVVEILLSDKRIDVCVNLNQPLSTAVYKGYHEIVSLLLKHPNMKITHRKNEILSLANPVVKEILEKDGRFS
eukprot:TRINITY_DN7197_c0_g1_i1.p1 TRINITY_DN7197_c0_g1~~TRINITY_DN7197_c0_g1_i1.p1  ORF type:complete len:193 (+),score=42.83 TRINITY_DN7197_c0_g1_i1:29-607(+)